MLGTGAVITSSDPLTGAPVTVTFSCGQAGRNPAGAVVFVGRADCDGPSEQVSCGYLNFFAGTAAARQWASQHPEVTVCVPRPSAGRRSGRCSTAVPDGSRRSGRSRSRTFLHSGLPLSPYARRVAVVPPRHPRP